MAKHYSCPVPFFTRCSTPSDESDSVSVLEPPVDHYLLTFIQGTKDIHAQSMLTDINAHTLKYFISGVRSTTAFYLVCELIA